VHASDYAFCLEVAEGKFEQGAGVQIGSCRDSGHSDYRNQQWVIEE
jgi:hypothetical protein